MRFFLTQGIKILRFLSLKVVIVHLFYELSFLVLSRNKWNENENEIIKS